ncbi:hypothetical protein GCM10023232_16060 [Sphingosinicella ginsenosidimutans]|uniref:Uncharacterized protein n=1 Tax=Allosphingosinicella ginsenosidimutans TaxID=1176539 RepID=A0A5C6TRV0_9SPHN|nr:hypothetical protein [Sphingosinicella ginsenosidimutans]TXC62675.1 hypothetical protein FRZ32_02760 [Sphingosinicella ginsenosidimutans]
MPKRSSRRRKSFPERLWRALRRAIRRRLETPWYFPAVGALAIGGILIGVTLGNNTVAAIDPLAFHETVVRPPRPPAEALPMPPRSVSADYGWPGGVDCGADCGAYAAEGTAGTPRGYDDRVPYFGSQGDMRAAIARARDELGSAFPETRPDAGIAGGPAERYSHFPITQDEEAAREAERDAEIQE